MTEWKRTIHGKAEIFDEYADDKIDIGEVSDKLVELFKKDPAYPSDTELVGLVEDLEIFGPEDGVDYFDVIMAAIYDWADANRIWIEPIPKRTACK